MKSNYLLTIIVAVVVGAGGFFAGTKYQQSKTPANRFENLQGGRNGTQQGRGGFRPVNGEILSLDDKSITVKLTDGSSKIVFFTDNTVYNKSSEGSKSDLKVGEKVAVFGADNPDGSVTAQNVQLNPQLRGVPTGAPRQ
ncbi:hypothetical protein A3D00_03485 [Candidatus Woesebacteria bacterium RIFCSPHIGHO2_02_FULL_38_9]|uniref:DUF5666 domain-containing protein n=1 Tax=Candidatus Woesebacteria bacterium RIFCSPHIGHO2_01_FULL_39_28 TaxID=1802496 RepID=A0A1F7YIV4_9BACT|nr:MAG: hypothetical protein A2627_00740 [Candidatus Woesebacteria bacterium RIFCSPHIGHO2_01_FULL_39_28]OGM32560.1 MAG: hypothetical protein A3D00_03485 [Candidatus Woesebacteria bacterium RIFCSPHIGHO2_02_FULL_38_9]OGM58753.1 MAG: hypothetical protein A3A50_03120 [Candidatus Woesebacteria bacterium RIFCSPLOWO2_01_FULL_38_20]